jgi:hypothetical protein
MDTSGLYVLKAVNDACEDKDPAAVKSALMVELAQTIVEESTTYRGMIDEMERVLDTVRIACEFLYTEKTEGSYLDYHNDVYPEGEK